MVREAVGDWIEAQEQQEFQIEHLAAVPFGHGVVFDHGDLQRVTQASQAA